MVTFSASSLLGDIGECSLPLIVLDKNDNNFFLSQTWSYCANPVTPEHTAKSSFQINAAVMQESNFWDVL